MIEKRRTRVERGIYRRTDGKLEIGFTDAAGRQRWRTIQGGIKAARARLAEEHTRRVKGEQIAANVRLTFDAAADSWWEVKAPSLRPNSRAIYSLHLRYLRAQFGPMRLAAIGSGDVLVWLAASKRDGVAASTRRKRLTVLSAIFHHASRHLGHTGTNPVRALEAHERPKSEDREPRRTLTDEEVSKLIDALAPPHRLLFSVLIETGARKSEVAGLTWDDIDLDAMEVRIRKQLAARSEERVEVKTRNSRRTIVITPETTRRLKEHYLASGRPDGTRLVFRRPNGLAWNYSSVGSAMRGACERAGIDGVSPHNLRHTHASRLIAAGWDVAEVAARLGDTVETVLSTYVHEWDERRRRNDQRDRLAAIYGKPMESTGGARRRTAATGTNAKAAELRANG